MSEKIIEELEHLEKCLVDRVHGVEYDKEITAMLYEKLRNVVQNNQHIRNCLGEIYSAPIIKSESYDKYISKIIGSTFYYDEKERIVNKNFEKIIAAVKNPDLILNLDNKINTDQYIQDTWQLCIDRLHQGDIEGSVTLAKTMVEGVCKDILMKLQIQFDEDDKLICLYKHLKNCWRLSPEDHVEQEFKTILGGLSNIVHGLCEIRNEYGDSHTQSYKLKSSPSSKKFNLSARHALLLINSSVTLATFLYQTYQDKGNG